MDMYIMHGIGSEGGQGVSIALMIVEPCQWRQKRKWWTGHSSINVSDSSGCGGAMASVVRDVVVIVRPRQPCQQYCQSCKGNDDKFFIAHRDASKGLELGDNSECWITGCQTVSTTSEA